MLIQFKLLKHNEEVLRIQRDSNFPGIPGRFIVFQGDHASFVKDITAACQEARARDEYRELMERAEALEGRVVIEVRE